MIENHFGKPGSGKSYSVMVDVILPALKSGSRVLTNIDGVSDKRCRLRLCAYLSLSEDELSSLYVPLSNEEIFTGACWRMVRAKDVFVIDEAQRYWPGGVLKPSDPEAFRFFGEHRHYGCAIHCITINPGNFQVPMRSYAEISHLYKKLGVLGLNHRYTRRDYASAVPSADTEVASTTSTYKKEIFGFYKSVTEEGNNVVGKQKNILLRPKILFSIALVIILASFSIYRITTKGLFHTPENTASVASSIPDPLPDRPSNSFLQQQQDIPYYTAYACPAPGVCYIRLSDGSVQLLKGGRLPGGAVYANSRLYLPGGSR